ncbi:hypothetical protein HAX54_009868 [Datura stramonium]|uniref:Indole-3-acetic acid-amido synthetase GH3.6 n=1 Tax=Datura stramonium TaxID=4076 RepID=A0ABS8TGW1_DATST|nr:hypothetical protein [Datura stramonium]
MPEAPKTSRKANDFIVAEENKKLFQFIEEVTTKADEVQKRVLAEILSRNADVEYLQRHGLNGYTDRETFKKVMPVITYEDIQPDIIRIANGDKSPIFCSQPISEFLTSSGTSGGKLMPTTEEELGRRSLLYSLLMPVMSQFVPDLEKGKAMYFLFIKSEAKTPGGLLARPVLTSYYKSPHFKNRRPDPYTNYTSPNEAILCPDSYQSMYSQMLCGLCQNAQVLRVGAVFASGFIRAIRFLEKHWPLLCEDIRTGTINTDLITDPSVREAVMKILKPDPELADFIEAEWKNHGKGSSLGCGLIPSMWMLLIVNLNPFASLRDVSYTPYSDYVLLRVLANSQKQWCHSSISTPKSLSEKEQQKLVDLVDVKIGQEYELVVTTYAGLYRYRVGDVLRVAGFKNNAPQFNFICRKNVVLSIDSDKTDEVELQNGMKNAVGHLMPFDAHVTEYTSYADTTTIPGHYVLFWEINVNGTTPIPPSVFEDCCLAVEESLNSVYRQGRASDKSIELLKSRMEIGTFDKLMDYAISLGASINQLQDTAVHEVYHRVELLNSRVMSNYFSPKCPKWVPGHKQWNNMN